MFTVVGDIFPPLERGRWQGLFGAVYGVASIMGPALGGYMTDTFGWRSVFCMNLPVGIFALAGIILLLPADISQRRSTAKGWAASRRDFAGRCGAGRTDGLPISRHPVRR